MNTQVVIKIVLSIIIYTLLQVFFLKNLVIFDVAFCFVYISVILFLPGSTSTTVSLFIAFFTGLFIDMFYNTGGLHASASLVIAYSRNFILKFLFPSKGLDNEIVVSLADMGTQRFIRYILIMTLIHHSYLFLVEAGSLHFFFHTLLKIVASVLFSSTVIFLVHTYLRNLRIL